MPLKSFIILVATLVVHPVFMGAQDLESFFSDQLDSTFAENKEAIGILMHVESPDNGISWSKAVGLSDTLAKTQLTNEQPVLIASNTKPYIAATVLRLVELDAINLDQSIDKLLPDKLNTLFSTDGYQFENITIRHLLSHTSGIADYVDEAYFEIVGNNPRYNWTKQEQMQRSIDIGSPLFDPGTDYSYGDINYLLLTEIIEGQTKLPFYIAVNKLLKFEELNLNHTWFKDLEPYPKNTESMAHQYSETRNWNSNNLSPTWDIYGGGGIASTIKEGALFFQYLFEGKIIEDETILAEMYTYVLAKDKSQYCLGIQNMSFPTFTAYYHGGWWGTDIAYSPETNSSVAVYTLQKSKRGKFAMLSIDFMKKLATVKAESSNR